MAILNFKTPKDRFAETVMTHFRKNNWPEVLTYDKDLFALDLGEGDRCFLHNHYNEWGKFDAQARYDLLERVVGLAFETRADRELGGDFDSLRDKLLPALRNRAYIDNMWMQEGLPDNPSLNQGANRAFCEHLSLMVMVDGVYSLTTCNAAMFETWGKSFDEVLPIAVENLRQQKKADFSLHEDGFYLSEEDVNDCVLPLIPDAFEALDLKGLPVAIIVARNLIVVAGSEDFPALEAMAAFAWEAYGNDSRPISLYPLILEEGEWSPFNPSKSRSIFLPQLIIQQSLSDYADQHELIEAYNQRVNRDIFVANILIREVEGTSEKHTLTTLSSGVEALIPKVEAMAVLSSDDKIIVRAWDDVIRVCGLKPLEPNTYPPLYLFEDGVSDEAWRILERQYETPPEFAD